MIYGKITSSEGALVSFSIFEGTAADEYHLMITPSAGTSADVQYRQIGQAVEEFLVSRRLVCPTVIYHRYFSSDVANHAAILPLQERNLENVISLVQQPPALGNKILAWVYLASFHQSTPQTSSDSRTFTVSHNGYDHIYTSGMVAPQQKGSLEQTNAIFGEYASLLMRGGLSLAGHCIRTWIFVRDIDNNYGGMVKARNAFFQKEGLTSATRFIASTGIEGKTAQPGALVAMDAYAIGGIAPAQISHLKGLSHLSPTHVYGVAFERGTTVDYGDRRHIFISGTASIDHRGHILHQGDITRQTGRTFTNIRVLLEEAGASFRDVSSMIVYLRDLADTSFIIAYLQEHFPGIPVVVAIAPVCRHGWLVEVECTAAVAVQNPQFRDF